MTGSLIVVARRLLDGAGHDAPGRLRIEGGVIVETGSGPAPGSAADHSTALAPRSPSDGPESDPASGPAGASVIQLDTVLPGFLDTHVHGARGVDFATVGVDPTPAIEHHARAGSTRLVASLATGPWVSTLDRLRELAPLVRAGDLAGLHLEGPFLADARRGAHDPALLRRPDAAAVDAALDAADGTLRMVTLAPELPGALEAIGRLVAAGVRVALGHTDAPADVMRRAVDAGATVVTHLFNGMPPLHHRSPGPVGVALTEESLVLELIGDGDHVDDLAVDLVRRAARGRYSLVSDAMSATGLGDGSYDLAGSSVVVSGGVARVAGGTALAGSTTPVAGAVARLLDRGVPLTEVLQATSTTPARALGLPDPALVVGARADLVGLRGSAVSHVLVGGRRMA